MTMTSREAMARVFCALRGFEYKGYDDDVPYLWFVYYSVDLGDGTVSNGSIVDQGVINTLYNHGFQPLEWPQIMPPWIKLDETFTRWEIAARVFCALLAVRFEYVTEEYVYYVYSPTEDESHLCWDERSQVFRCLEKHGLQIQSWPDALPLKDWSPFIPAEISLE